MKRSKLVYGGEYAIGTRKGARPLSLKQSHHVVFRADDGVVSFLEKERRDFILSEIKKWASHFKVKVYCQSINSNHIHLILYGKKLSALHGFLRVCPGQIAQKFKLGAQKFWKHLVFTRIIPWGKAFEYVKKYIEQNTLEAAGLVAYAPRKTRYGP